MAGVVFFMANRSRAPQSVAVNDQTAGSLPSVSGVATSHAASGASAQTAGNAVEETNKNPSRFGASHGPDEPGGPNLNVNDQTAVSLPSVSEAGTSHTASGASAQTAGNTVDEANQNPSRFGASHGPDKPADDKFNQPAPIVAPADKTPIKIGAFYSSSGELAKREANIRDATTFAIEELNAAGGLLGRPIELVETDVQSDWKTLSEKSRQLIDDGASVLMNASASDPLRKTAISVCEELDSLYLAPHRYGGLETSAHAAYMGALPNQLMVPVAEWATKQGKTRFFLLGMKDSAFSHVVNLVLRDSMKAIGGEIVGESYLPRGNHGTDATIDVIRSSRADVIISTIQGEANIGFYRALRKPQANTDPVSYTHLTLPTTPYV